MLKRGLQVDCDPYKTSVFKKYLKNAIKQECGGCGREELSNVAEN